MKSFDQAFIEKIKEIIFENISNEDFGIEDLVHLSRIDRSTIHHKLLESTGKSTVQFIRQVRLERALEILQSEDITASETAFRVGFSSPAYFNTCFHEHFGYPPGEVARNSKDQRSNCNGIEPDNVPGKKGTMIFGSTTAIYRSIALFSVAGLVFILSILGVKNKILSLTGKGSKSIIICPFETIKQDLESEKWAFGTTENIRNSLINIKGLHVIPYNPMVVSDGNFITAVRKQGANFMLQGNVFGDSAHIQVIVNLINTKDNHYEWSEKYNDKIQNFFDLQSKIALMVASKLKVTIPDEEKKKIKKFPTRNAEAIRYYMQGRFSMKKRCWRCEDIEVYTAPFEKAIALDNNYALAYAGLADVYLTFAITHSYNPTVMAFARARDNIFIALKLDSTLAEAHATNGAILYYFGHKWEMAKAELEIALKLNPEYALAHKYYADLMFILRKKNEYRVQTYSAAKLDPESIYFILHEAKALLGEKKYVEALADYNKIMRIFPGNYSVYYHLWDYYRILKDDKNAIDNLKKALLIDEEGRINPDTIYQIYASNGIYGVEKWLIEYNSQNDTKASWEEIASYYALHGKKKKALEWIENAEKWENPTLPRINGNEDFDNLRNEPRFKAIINRLGLSAYQ